MSTIERRGPSGTRGAPPWALAAGFAVLVVGLLVWAKWQPYWVKVPSVAGSHSLGSSILTGRAPAPPEVSLSAGLAFAGTYFLAIWPALVAGLVIAAGVQTLLPPDWVARTFSRRPGGALRGGALAVPSMMCSCCAAPVAVGLRRRAASVRSSLTYWLTNPALNPVVLVFCAFVLPWQWTALRAASGVVVVVAAVTLATWWAGRAVPDGAPTADAGASPSPTSPAAPVRSAVPAEPAAGDDRPPAVRFLLALGWLVIRLLPEYLVLVVALGALRGVLFPVGASWLASPSGAEVAAVVAGVVLLAVAGTLLPIPTGAEVAVVAALLAAGVAGPLAAALLITLPAVSLPSVLMVRGVFPRGLLVGVAGVVAAVGVLTAAASLVM